jgi:hypothetical protein
MSCISLESKGNRTLHRTRNAIAFLDRLLEEQEPDRIVYLAVPFETYQDFFQLSFIQRALVRYQVKLIVYAPEQEEIRLWIK